MVFPDDLIHMFLDWTHQSWLLKRNCPNNTAKFKSSMDLKKKLILINCFNLITFCYYFFIQIFKNNLYKSDSHNTSWYAQLVNHFDVFPCLIRKVSVVNLWNWMLHSQIIFSSFLLWADSNFELLVKELLSFFFQSVGIQWKKVVNDFSLVGDSEYFFSKLVVSNGPHWASRIGDFDTHDEVFNSFFDVLVTMLAVT